MNVNQPLNGDKTDLGYDTFNEHPPKSKYRKAPILDKPDSDIILKNIHGSSSSDIEAHDSEALINDIIEKLRGISRFRLNNLSLTNTLQALPQRIFDRLCWQIITENQSHCLDNFLKSVSLEALKKNIGLEGASLEKYQDDIKCLAECKQIIRDAIERSSMSSVSTNPNFIDRLARALELISQSTGPNNVWEATQFLQASSMLVLIPFVLTLTIYQLEGNRIPSYVDPLVVLTCVASLIFMGVTSFKIYKYIRPIPVQLYPLENYCLKVTEDRIEPLLCRDEVIERIFSCWHSTHKTSRHHPLLVGPAGAGKSVILLEVARRITLGEFSSKELKKSLAKKTMFGGSAALLLPTNQMNETLDKIGMLLQVVKPHKNDIILALDEIQVLMNDKYGPRYGELLKSILDTTPQGLPYVIAATTKEEYMKFIYPYKARRRRFEVIFVDPLEKEEVKLVLRQMVSLHYPQISVSEEILDHVYQRTQEISHLSAGCQPEISKQVLGKAIAQLSTSLSQLSSQKQLRQMEIELKNLRLRYASSFDSAGIRQDIQEKEKDLNILKNAVLNESEGIKKYQSVSERLVNCKLKLQLLAEEIQTQRSSKKKMEAEKEFCFYFYYIIPCLHEELNNIKGEYELTIRELNQQLIDDIIEEEQQSSAKAAQNISDVAQDTKGKGKVNNP